MSDENYYDIRRERDSLRAELERVKGVCVDLNRERNTTFYQSCINKNEADSLRLSTEKQNEAAKKYREAIELLGDHHRNCECNCMDYRGIAKAALEGK